MSSAVQTDLRTDVAQMASDPHFVLMLAHQLPPDDIPIFGDDPDQSIDIFGMIPHQLREFLNLSLQTFEPPDDVFHRIGIRPRLDHGLNRSLMFHTHSFITA